MTIILGVIIVFWGRRPSLLSSGGWISCFPVGGSSFPFQASSSGCRLPPRQPSSAFLFGAVDSALIIVTSCPRKLFVFAGYSCLGCCFFYAWLSGFAVDTQSFCC